MKNKKSLESKTIRVIRRIARILSLFLILLTLVFVIFYLKTDKFHHTSACIMFSSETTTKAFGMVVLAEAGLFGLFTAIMCMSQMWAIATDTTVRPTL